MRHAYIYDHVRTPRGRGKAGGGLQLVPPVDLAAQTLRAVRERTGVEAGRIEDVAMGCVAAVADQGCNLGRLAALRAGLGDGVPGKHVNRYCGSGLEAVNAAAAQVMSGQADFVIGAGVECLSRVPIGADGGAWAVDPQVAFETHFVPQGIGADLIATLRGYSRSDVDAYAVESHRRAAAAWNEGRFDRSVIPALDRFGRLALARDEHVRASTSVESLATLQPSFEALGRQGGFDEIAKLKYPSVERIEHVHHAGNSSGLVDGAAAMLLGSEAGLALGLRARARIRSFAVVGSEPTIMLTGPAPATEKALRLAGMSIRDVDLFEVNEAFASVVLLFMEKLDVPADRVNVNGGAIAMGHPMGATGVMLAGAVLDELEVRGLGVGLVTLCVGAGMGIATIIERV